MEQLFAGRSGGVRRPLPPERRRVPGAGGGAESAGWPPSAPTPAGQPGKRRGWRVKLLMAAALYALAALLFAADHPAADRLERHVRVWMTQSWDFAAAESWYTSAIGRIPSIVPPFGARRAADEPRYVRPALGTVARGYAGEGMWISLTQPDVKAIAEGWVTYTGYTPDTGLTVIVQHADGLESVYGHLSAVAVNKNDWVQREAQLGTVTDETDRAAAQLYVAVKRQGQYIHPGEVIPFD